MGCKIFDKLGIGIAIGETVDACRNSKRTFCILILFISSFMFFQIFLSERVEAADYWVTSTNK